MMGAILLIFALLILDSLLVTTADTKVTVYNETLTTVTEAGETVAFTPGSCGVHSFAPIYVTNATGGETIGSGNYTYNLRTGKVSATAGATTLGVNNTDWNITYSYSFGNKSICESTNKTIVGQGKFGDYFDLIVLAIVVAVVISLLSVVLSTKKVK